MRRDDALRSIDGVVKTAKRGVLEHLSEMKRTGQLTGVYLDDAKRNVLEFLTLWLKDPHIARLSPNLQRGLTQAIEDAAKGDDGYRRWEQIVNAFARRVMFGTGGIRALMAFDRKSIETLKKEGVDAPILKGENTINNLVLMRAAYGIARWFFEQSGRNMEPAPKAVVGCDSRIQGPGFAKAIAEVLLQEGMEVYLFDEPVPYPEVTFAVPRLKADVGIFISASHNDYRYNGFKLSGPNGAQIPLEQRDEIVKHIERASFSEIQLVPLEKLQESKDQAIGRLHFLGGRRRLARKGIRYFGRDLIAIHDDYISHVRNFFMSNELLDEGGAAADMKIVFAAFNGAGRTTVPNILDALGFRHVYSIRNLFSINGLFPAFKSTPGEEQQPDPGDPRAACIALDWLSKEGKNKRKDYIPWNEADLLIGTDPDADRCGVVVHPPKELAKLITDDHYPRYTRQHMLIPADDMWALVVWYRLAMQKGRLDPRDKFIALSHTTSDVLTFLARKHGLGVLKTWVGFSWLSTAVRRAWAGTVPMSISEGCSEAGQEMRDLVFFDTTDMNPERRVNLAAMEQSNGFSILGGPPLGNHAMGEGGHVLDKDGTLAALLIAEIACYAKQQGTDILSLLARHIYADESVGLFTNYYEPDPLDGEYPGLAGDTKKRGILDKAEALCGSVAQSGLSLGSRKATSSQKYWTGKYDSLNGTGFPDEGFRFYFGDKINHLTIRPSGTTNSLRFHVQLYGGVLTTPGEAWRKRLELEREAKDIVDEAREIVGAPRAEGAVY
jgi:phosphoglucomutase